MVDGFMVRGDMAYRFFILVLVLGFSSSGCILLLADAIGKSASRGRPSSKTVQEKVRDVPSSGPVDSRVISGSRQDVFNTAVSILLDRGYFIVTSDDAAGMVIAEQQEPRQVQIKVSIVESSAQSSSLRVLILDQNGPVKDPAFVARLSEEIQTEVIRRQSRRQPVKR